MATVALWGLSAFLLGADGPASLTAAYDLWLRGNYREAFEQYSSLTKDDPAAVARGKARCLRSEGKYDEADKTLAAALTTTPNDANALADAADLALLRGQYDRAREFAERSVKADGKHLLGRWVRAQVLCVTGKAAQALPEFKWFIEHYNQAQPSEPEKLYFIARAAAEYALRNKAHDELDFILNDLLPDALKAEEHFWFAPWFGGMLLLEKYNKAQGVPELRSALKINPQAAEVLVGLGIAALQDYDFVEGLSFANRALEVNPNFPDALRLKADLLLADERTPEALKLLEQALAINPVSEETLGRLAACRFILRQPEKAAAIEKQVLARNVAPGVFYTLLADQLERRRQFDLAEGYYRKAIAAGPWMAGPRNGLGMLSMRVGKEDQARVAFADARAIDPYHVRVLNMVKVLRHMENYKVLRGKHYEVIVSPELDELLGKYMLEYLERTHDTLCKRFAYEPPGHTKIEILKDHQWFSGRVVGVPSIGTVGACTGKVVALASPRSLPSKYNWARVLTHEVTHIITLQQTDFNIPHWYTEALAVLSEGYPRPETWNDLLVERVPKGDLLNLDNINHAFVRPKTPLDWQMAYCQSLLYAQYMLERFGADALAKMLEAYHQGLETEAAIMKCFNVAKADFEKGYREYLHKVTKGIATWKSRKERPFAEVERLRRANPKDADLTAELALHHLQRRNARQARELAKEALALRKHHPLALVVLAKMELSIGKIEEALQMLLPGYNAADPDPQVLEMLAGLYVRMKRHADAMALYAAAAQRDPLRSRWQEGYILAALKLQEEGGKVDDAKLMVALEKLARMDADNLKVRKKLADLSAKNKDWAKAEEWARQTLYVEVTDVDAHRHLADASLARKQYHAAIDEYEWLIAKRPQETELYRKAAEAHLGVGNAVKARQLLRDYLQKHPNDARAKELLQEALRK